MGELVDELVSEPLTELLDELVMELGVELDSEVEEDSVEMVQEDDELEDPELLEDAELEEVGDEDGGEVAHGIRNMDVVVWQPVWQVVSQNVVVGRPVRQVQG